MRCCLKSVTLNIITKYHTKVKDNAGMSEKEKKRALPIRALLFVKRIICRLCSKMWRLAIPFVVLFTIVIGVAADYYL